jgi:hypothetical protein
LEEIRQGLGKKLDKRLEKIGQALGKNLDKRLENIQALWKIHKCPEIMTGANFHFETVKLCMLDKNYALHTT